MSLCIHLQCIYKGHSETNASRYFSWITLQVCKLISCHVCSLWVLTFIFPHINHRFAHIFFSTGPKLASHSCKSCCQPPRATFWWPHWQDCHWRSVYHESCPSLGQTGEHVMVKVQDCIHCVWHNSPPRFQNGLPCQDAGMGPGIIVMKENVSFFLWSSCWNLYLQLLHSEHNQLYILFPGYLQG